MSPNELIDSLKVLGLGAPLEELEKEVLRKRGEYNGKDKRSTRKRKRTKTTT